MTTMTQIKLAFQVSPIWFTGPPVAQQPGAMQPIIAVTDPTLYAAAQNLARGTGSETQTDLDDAFGSFNVLPGGTLNVQEVAKYPFANQHIAGNATIFQPLQVSLIWETPLRGPNPPAPGTDAWMIRYQTITTLQAAVYNHNNSGGTFTVVTPSFIYTDMLLTALTDAARGGNPVPQNAWRFDFEKPMITLQDLQSAQSALMSKISFGLVTPGTWSGLPAGIGLAAELPQYLFGGTYTAPPSVMAAHGGAYSPGATAQ